MGLTHIRTPRHFVLEERLERYTVAIEGYPETLAGHWAEACTPAIGDPSAQPFDSVHLDLGCGKGSYLVECARRDPQTLYLGTDIEPICIAYAAQRIVESGLPNALVIPRGTDALEHIFEPGELNAISLNFPTPYPKRRFARRRTVTVDNLLIYRTLLAPGGTLMFRTDSQPLYDYALIQLEAAGYRTRWTSGDMRAEYPDIPQTEYEERLVAEGARIFGICAAPGPEPTPEAIECGHTAEQSLMAYLPENVESLTYVPHGMEAAVTNLINRRRHAARQAQHER